MSPAKIIGLSLFVVVTGTAHLRADASRRQEGNCPNYWAPVQSCSLGWDQADLKSECEGAIVGTSYAGCAVASEGHTCSVSTYSLNCHFVSGQ